MLTIIQVGDNPASSIYVRNKIKAVENAGLKAEHFASRRGCRWRDGALLVGRVRWMGY